MSDVSPLKQSKLIEKIALLQQRLANGWIVLALFLLFVFLLFGLSPYFESQFIPEGKPQAAELQLDVSNGFPPLMTQPRFVEIMSDWIVNDNVQEVVQGYRRTLILVDFILPLSYGLFFFGFFSWLAVDNSLTIRWLKPLDIISNRTPSRVALFALLTPIIAMMADWIENSFHLLALSNVNTLADLQSVSSSFVTFASIAALIKWILLLILILFALAAYLYRGYKWTRQR